MVFRPCIDIHAGKVKQIVGSSLTGDDQQLVTNFEATMEAADFARWVLCVCVWLGGCDSLVCPDGSATVLTGRATNTH